MDAHVEGFLRQTKQDKATQGHIFAEKAENQNNGLKVAFLIISFALCRVHAS
jgi:hypothetical protein